jgi:predicted RND superfamily exporter protein
MVGFSGLVFAHHPGLNAIGKLALLGISLALIAALSVLPSVLQLTEARRKFNPSPKKKNTALPG